MSPRLRDMKRNIPCSQLTCQWNITIINRKYISNWSIFQPAVLVSLRVYLIRSFLGDSQVTIFLHSTIDHNYHSIFAALLLPEKCTVCSTGYSFRISTKFSEFPYFGHFIFQFLKSNHLLNDLLYIDSFCFSFRENHFTQRKPKKPPPPPNFPMIGSPYYFQKVLCFFFRLEKFPVEQKSQRGVVFLHSEHPSEHLKLASHSRHRRGYLCQPFRPRGPTRSDGRGSLRNGWLVVGSMDPGFWSFLGDGPGFEKCRGWKNTTRFMYHAFNGETLKSHQLFDEATWSSSMMF